LSAILEMARSIPICFLFLVLVAFSFFGSSSKEVSFFSFAVTFFFGSFLGFLPSFSSSVIRVFVSFLTLSFFIAFVFSGTFF
jgi:hypothetical protein